MQPPSSADDFEERKKTLLQPVLFEAGAALLDCQGFEFGVALLLFHFSRLGAKGLEPEKVSLILDDKEKKTAGQLVAMLKKHVTVSEGIEAALEGALRARNYLVHRVLIDNVEKLEREETRAALVQEIRKRRAEVRKAHENLGPFIMGFSAALDGLDQKQMERALRERLS
jgi:hypothetical protein